MKNHKEIFEALLSGKRICHAQSRRDMYYLNIEGKLLYQAYGLFFPTEKCLVEFGSPLSWEIYEEPNKEIKLTPDMVGRKVRLRNGNIEIICRYISSRDEIYKREYWTYSAGCCENGNHMGNTGGPSEFDIVEILD